MGGRGHLWPKPGVAQGCRAVRVLRRAAQRQRPARHPPRDGAHHQGHLLPFPNTAGQARGPQGRLGHPRVARGAWRGKGTRHHQGGHWPEHFGGGLQPPVQGGRDALYRRVERPHQAHRLLAGHGAPVRNVPNQVHRKRVVAPEETV